MRWSRNWRPVKRVLVRSRRCEEDAELLARLHKPATQATGISMIHNEPSSRGGFSLYVPEYYTPGVATSGLSMRLHGGQRQWAGGFWWSWLRGRARSHGAILGCPTPRGNHLGL